MTFQPSDFAIIIVAAGRGERAGREGGPKQYRSLAGMPILRHTLTAFGQHMRDAHYVVAIHPDDRLLYEEAVEGLPYDVEAVDGGKTRQASTRLALQALRERRPAAVMIHDGVRPFIGKALLERIAAAVRPGVAVLPALAVPDTLKRATAAGLVQATVPRDGLFAAQTPQGFAYADICDAHEKAASDDREDFTDDAAIAEWAGLEVRIVEGDAANTKITWPRDLEQAEMRMSTPCPAFPDVRTGNGYDVHSFEDGDHVMLCGVSIPHDRKLSGHSDADVGLHALTDALLATCGEGDIGTHFPPSDPQWKGAASRQFVEHAARLVRQAGGRIANADVTLICEAPKVGPHRQAMCAAMAAMLGISADRVSMKATTNERLGFVGREEGIAAIATATVVFPGEVPA